MSFYKLYDFLRDLRKNNSKEWMDANRKRYHEVRDWYIGWLNEMDAHLGQVDTDYYATSGKKAINRINNNLMYHPDKPIYKDHFGAGLDKAPNTGDFYIHLGINESFIAGGFYRPPSKILGSIREAIDYNGEEFKKIINKKSFKDMFGGLMEDDMLKTSPKGFSQDHRHIKLLRHKSFAVSHPVTQKEVQQDNFKEKVIEVYREMLPLRRYLNRAVTV